MEPQTSACRIRFEKMDELTYNSSMTITEIKAELHNRIEHLSEAQIKKLQKMVNDAFPEKTRPKAPKRRQLVGSMKGLVIYMADDFNEPLEDFKEYMPE